MNLVVKLLSWIFESYVVAKSDLSAARALEYQKLYHLNLNLYHDSYLNIFLFPSQAFEYQGKVHPPLENW